MRKINHLISLLFLMSVVPGCTGYTPGAPKHGITTGDFVGSEGDTTVVLTVNSILVLPVFYDEGVKPEKTSEGVFYDALINAFRSDVDIELKSDSRLIRDPRKDTNSSCSTYGIEAGAKYGVDGVLCTTLHRYTERDGSSLGAERPAALSFSMQILRISDGKQVWAGDFVFRDQALNANLFDLDRRMNERAGSGGWQSARSALERGFREASQDFAKKRLEKFAPGQF